MQILNWLISKLVGHKNAYNLQRSHTIKSQHKQKAENNMHKKIININMLNHFLNLK